MIDPIGGIPSVEKNQTSHVFINLSQEYSDIVSELYIGHIEPDQRDLHLANLNTMHEILTLASSKSDVMTQRGSSPLHSSSQQQDTTAFNFYFEERVDVRSYDTDNYARKFTLHNLIEDELVDKNRLVALLDDSFGKNLDTDSYFERINNSLTTLVIVGDYDGAAIITWEYSGTNKIAYLDKFAIAKNQGLPGLADVIFKIILSSHPHELIWRSRKVNPVNKVVL
ncbi:hypothetical protein G9P44_005445 [Scheffersomyces stipitis]|nr:hypothetical protein G9P44_005445 [Scheffersomyces stipitis]